MSYPGAEKALEEMSNLTHPSEHPIEHDLAVALLAFVEAVKDDFRSVHAEVEVLRKSVEELNERVQRGATGGAKG